MFRIRLSYLVFLLLFCVATTSAYANGINPPRPFGSKVVTASCTDRKSGVSTIVQRAQIIIDEPSGGLEVRLEKSGQEIIQLSEITQLNIVTGKPGTDGFAEASLERLEPNDKDNGFVRLRASGKPVRLTGFSIDLKRVSVPLESCITVVLNTSQPSAEKRRSLKKR